MGQVMDIIKGTYESMVGFMSQTGPKLVAAAIIVVAGLLVARIAKAAMNRLLLVIRFENIANKLGIASALERAEVKQSSSEIVCTMVYWTFLVFTLLATLGTLGIAGTDAVTSLLAFIPQVVLAAAILVLGLNVSAFVSKLVQTAAVNAEIRQARLVRNAMHYGISTLVVLLALQQFDIPPQLLGHAFLIFFGGTCLAMALAFGLGGRDLAASIAQSTWKQEKEQSRTLSEASDLGNEVIPQSGRKHQRGRHLAA